MKRGRKTFKRSYKKRSYSKSTVPRRFNAGIQSKKSRYSNECFERIEIRVAVKLFKVGAKADSALSNYYIACDDQAEDNAPYNTYALAARPKFKAFARMYS